MKVVFILLGHFLLSTFLLLHNWHWISDEVEVWEPWDTVELSVMFVLLLLPVACACYYFTERDEENSESLRPSKLGYTLSPDSASSWVTLNDARPTGLE